MLRWCLAKLAYKRIKQALKKTFRLLCFILRKCSNHLSIIVNTREARILFFILSILDEFTVFSLCKTSRNSSTVGQYEGNNKNRDTFLNFLVIFAYLSLRLPLFRTSKLSRLRRPLRIGRGAPRAESRA